MKSALVLAALTTFAAAQNIFIGAPAPGTRLSPGHKFVVLVERVNNFILSDDVSVGIGLLSCTNAPIEGNCGRDEGSSTIGRVLFAGPFLSFDQNFTVTVPDDFPSGPAALSIAHFFLLGTKDVSTTARLEIRSEIVNIA